MVGRISGRAICLAASALVAAGAAGMGRAAAQDPGAAWKGGKLYVPAALSKSGAPCDSAPDGKCAGDIKPGKHPVIVFLHGCGGPRSPGPFLDVGAVVVAPNSFAGGAQCRRDAAYMAQFVKTRHGDVAHAAARVKAAAWADPGRLVLAGFSNGAQSAATYPGGEFKARAIVAWTCNNPRAPDQNGVKGSGPVLALLGTADEYYKQIGLSGDCGSAISARPGSRSVMVQGGGHEILDHAATREAVAAFVPDAIK